MPKSLDALFRHPSDPTRIIVITIICTRKALAVPNLPITTTTAICGTEIWTSIDSRNAAKESS